MKSYLLFVFTSIFLIQGCSDLNSPDEDDGRNLLLEKREKEEALRLKKMNTFIALSDSLHSVNSTTESIGYLDSALVLAKSEHGIINFKKANYLFELRKYEDAGVTFALSGDEGFKKDTSYYLAALSFEKVRKRQEAVDNLHKAIALGHEDADKLHERINPERRRVVDYNIRCCDGTISYSTSRRGTCSHHGGVCNWNEPVYETYRKY
ncbi:MAG: hypothetical protein Crog4KO_10160 [Crocinitomicaceae bacterium]